MSRFASRVWCRAASGPRYRKNDPAAPDRTSAEGRATGEHRASLFPVLPAKHTSAAKLLLLL